MKISIILACLTGSFALSGCSGFREAYETPWDRNKAASVSICPDANACLNQCNEPLLDYGDNPPPQRIDIDAINPLRPGKKVEAPDPGPPLRLRQRKPQPPKEDEYPEEGVRGVIAKSL